MYNRRRHIAVAKEEKMDHPARTIVSETVERSRLDNSNPAELEDACLALLDWRRKHDETSTLMSGGPQMTRDQP